MLFKDLPAIDIPPGINAVYISVCETGEVKPGIGDVASRVAKIQQDLHFITTPKVVALLPAYRAIESDIHARLFQSRSRSSGPYMREIYHPTYEVKKLVIEAWKCGFTVDDLMDPYPTVRRNFTFDNGETLRFEFTYMQLIETGALAPSYILNRRCHKCGVLRNSLEFLNDYDVKSLGVRAKKDYLVLESTDYCFLCAPKSLVLPAKIAFNKGQTCIRLGTVFSKDGRVVPGFDRDLDQWLPLHRFGVRRMAKKPREQNNVDFHTLRLQPYTLRGGNDRGKNL